MSEKMELMEGAIEGEQIVIKKTIVLTLDELIRKVNTKILNINP